jgi:dihydrofolate synthase/folylpolyglutamate synthase
LQLGDTLKAIAREKGGIIKPGVLVISGVTEEEPRTEIRRIARETGSRLVEAGVDFTFEYSPPKHLEQEPHCGILDFVSFSPLPLAGTTKWSGQGVRADSLTTQVRRNEACHPYELSLLGRHQAANAAVALAAIFELRRQGWNIPEGALRRGLAEVRLSARVEVVARQPAVILDSAHNTASIAALIAALEESFSVRRRHLIFAATKDKDNRGMMKLLLDAFDEIYLARYTSNPRFVPPEELAAVAYELKGKRYPTFSSPAEAWEIAAKNAAAEDLICITGSFFLAGEMRKIIG